jgi:hypothetical protein
MFISSFKMRQRRVFSELSVLKAKQKHLQPHNLPQVITDTGGYQSESAGHSGRAV